MTLTFASFQCKTSSVLFPKKRKRYLATQTVFYKLYKAKDVSRAHTLIFSQVQPVLSHSATLLQRNKVLLNLEQHHGRGQQRLHLLSHSCCYQGCHRTAPGGGDPQQTEQVSVQDTWKPQALMSKAHTLEEDWPRIKVYGMLPVCVWSPAPSRYLWLNPLVLPPSIPQIQTRALYSRLVSTLSRQITRIISLFPFQITVLLEA